MPSGPSVTIIVPTLNEEKYIRQAVGSLIPPGESRDIVFTRPGVYAIRCAIHPQMKLTVEVSEQE